MEIQHLIGSSPEDSDGLKGQSLNRQGRLSGCQPGEIESILMWRICEEYVNKTVLMTLNDIKWLKCGLQYAF